MPSSVSVGSRSPRSFLIFSYSSAVKPCCRRVSAEKAEVREVVMGKLYCRTSEAALEGSFGGVMRKFQATSCPSNPYAGYLPVRFPPDEIHHCRNCRPHRPRQDGAGKGANRNRCRPPERRKASWHHHRSRFRS